MKNFDNKDLRSIMSPFIIVLFLVSLSNLDPAKGLRDGEIIKTLSESNAATIKFTEAVSKLDLDGLINAMKDVTKVLSTYMNATFITSRLVFCLKRATKDLVKAQKEHTQSLGPLIAKSKAIMDKMTGTSPFSKGAESVIRFYQAMPLLGVLPSENEESTPFDKAMSNVEGCSDPLSESITEIDELDPKFITKKQLPLYVSSVVGFYYACFMLQTQMVGLGAFETIENFQLSTEIGFFRDGIKKLLSVKMPEKIKELQKMAK